MKEVGLLVDAASRLTEPFLLVIVVIGSMETLISRV